MKSRSVLLGRRHAPQQINKGRRFLRTVKAGLSDATMRQIRGTRQPRPKRKARAAPSRYMSAILSGRTSTPASWSAQTSRADPGLLSLTAQHPTATIDNSAADYYTAESQLFP